MTWRPIATAPKDGTRFVGLTHLPLRRRITWWGKTSHVPLYGWCHGRAEDVDLWEPTHWLPYKGGRDDSGRT